MTKATKRQGQLALTRGLRQLREYIRGAGDYGPTEQVALPDGSYLEARLKKSADGGKLLGIWEIVRHYSDGRPRRKYPAN